MKLKDIGEFGLINKIARLIKNSNSVFKGIGDDCAVLKYTKDKYLLFTTDMIIEDVHFKLDKTTPQQIGHKSLAVNISDIAACGAIPKWAVISVGLPRNISLDFVNKIYSGIRNLSNKFNIDMVGGDTNLSEKMVISIALLGTADKRKLILRSNAKIGDVIFLTNRLKANPNHLRFTPRIKESQFLVKNFKINSMIDISDGLLINLGHILSGSKAGARIYESLIPHEAGSIKKLLKTGEQFELLFTADKKQAPKLLQKAKIKKINITAIGEITDNTGKIIFVNREGKEEELRPKGYTHF